MSEMRVQVTVAVQDPDQVDVAALVAKLPRGRAEVTAVFGGLNVDFGKRFGHDCDRASGCRGVLAPAIGLEAKGLGLMVAQPLAASHRRTFRAALQRFE